MKKAIIGVIISLISFWPLSIFAAETNYRFTGQELDPTGLYYYGQRYYQPDIGRFTQVDPLQNYLTTPELKKRTNKELEEVLADPQQLNSYSYTAGNPINQIDPTGEFNRETGEVETGDSLSKIFGERWQEVADYNNLKNPNLIYPGQVLKIPWTEESFLDKAVDVGSSVVPGVSDIRDVAEFIYGKDFSTGEKISYLERAEVGALALLPVVSGPLLRKAEKFGKKLSKMVNQKIISNNYVKKISKTLGVNPKKVMDKLDLPGQLEKIINGLEQGINDYGGRLINTIFRR